MTWVHEREREREGERPERARKNIKIFPVYLSNIHIYVICIYNNQIFVKIHQKNERAERGKNWSV